MSYPIISRKTKDNIDKIEARFLIETFKLKLDRDKCSGCCICVRLCPKQAFTTAKPEGPKILFGKQVIFKRKKYSVPFIHDPSICVFCGLCTYMCPFDAFRLYKKGEIIEPQNIKIAKLKAIPKLDAKIVKLDSGVEVKVYMKGSIGINIEECNVDCKNCADLCPSGAIIVKPDIISKNKSEWEQDIKMEIYPNKYIFCGACRSICPTEAIKLEINEVFYSGDFNSPFWDYVIERLKFKKSE